MSGNVHSFRPANENAGSKYVTITLAFELLEYNDARGRSPFRRWFNRLDHVTAGRIAVILERMTEGNLGDIRPLGNGVIERRVNFGPGYRIYFGRDAQTIIILLGAGDKQHQQRDIQEVRR